MPGRHRILAVDDHPDWLSALSHLLQGAGYEVIAASNGQECLDLTRRERPDLVLLDVALPDISGLEVLKAIKANPELQDMLVVHLSAERVRPEQQALGLNTGADGYIVRPIGNQELLARVQTLLRQKDLLDALRQSEARIKRIINHNADGVVVVDEQGVIQFANPAAETIFGRPNAQLLGQPFGFPMVNGQAVEIEILSGTAKPRIAEMRVVETEWESRPACLASLRDVTERKQTEEALGRANAQLASANELLAEADRRKDEFLAMLAHELRNPLAPVRNAVQILNLIGPPEPNLQRQREIIERQVTHMARLLDDLLDVSRTTRGKVILDRKPLRLSDVLAHAIETVSPLIEARRHTLEVTLPPEDLRVEGDIDRLTQALGNLLANAAKYTDEGGRIWVRAECTESAPWVVIRVRDTGTGIAPELLPRVFDLFTQADHSLGRAQGGLGIGLTMVKRLVELHGGTVEAYSAGLGQGSEFTVRLPALPDETPADARPRPPKEPAAPMLPRRILVVDDVADIATSLAELLQLWGHDVRMALDGPAALAVARDFQPEVVLLDIGLPGLDGFETARRLRQEHAGQPLVLVALTGYAQESDRQTAREAGFDHHLTKPVDLGDLQSLLARSAT